MATSVKLDDDLESRVQRLADMRRRSAHWIMREAIRDYVEREGARENFKREALASWTAHQERGQHLTGQEVRDWLQTWGKETKTDIPECHESLSRKVRHGAWSAGGVSWSNKIPKRRCVPVKRLHSAGPTGQRAEIVTACIILTGETIPRFITAYPRGS